MSRKIKLVSIDGDGCLFAYTHIGSAFHSSWDAVAFAYGLKETWDARAKKYAGKKNQAGLWAQEDAADLRGRPVSLAAPTLYPIPYSNGAREFLKASRGRLVRGLLSGCLDIVGKRAAAETELDFCFCNTLRADAGIFSGTMDTPFPSGTSTCLLPNFAKNIELRPRRFAMWAITRMTWPALNASAWPSPSTQRRKRSDAWPGMSSPISASSTASWVWEND